MVQMTSTVEWPDSTDAIAAVVASKSCLTVRVEGSGVWMAVEEGTGVEVGFGMTV